MMRAQTGPKSAITIVVLYLSFISGISPLHNFLSGFEHFPYGLLLILLMRRTGLWPLLLASFMAFFYTVSLIYYALEGVSAPIAYLLQSLNFVAPLFYLRGNEALFGHIAYRVFWLYMIVGALQIVGMLKPVEPILELFIARFSGGTGDGFRGVSMLETEPARAGFQLLILYIISSQWHKRRLPLTTITLILAQVMLIRSTTGILLTAAYLGVTILPKVFSRPKSIIVAGVAAFGVLGFALQQPKVNLIVAFYQQDGLSGVFTALAAVSGGRFLATYTTIIEILSWPLGHGADPEFFERGREELKNRFQVEGFRTRISNRPVSGLLNYLYVYGLAALVLFWLVLRNNISRQRFTSVSVAVLLIGIIYTPPGSELWVLAMASSFRMPRTALQLNDQAVPYTPPG